MLGLEQLRGVKVGLVLDEPKMAPRARGSLSLDVSDVSLDVDWRRSGRVKSKGKDKVTRSFAGGSVPAYPFVVSSLKISRKERDLGGV